MPFDELEGHVRQLVEQLQKEKREHDAAMRRARARAGRK